MGFSELQDAEEGLPPRQRRQLGADSLRERAAAAAARARRAPRGRHGLVAVPRRRAGGRMAQGGAACMGTPRTIRRNSP